MNKNEDIVSLWDNEFPYLDINNKEKHQKLKDLQEKYNTFDPYYVRAGAVKNTRDKFDAQWNEYKSLADTHFLSEIRKHFHERTWEMWVGNYLKNQQFTVVSNQEGPDFITNNSTYFECIAVNNGFGENKVPEMQLGVTQDVPMDKILLRITSGLKEKGLRKYNGWKSKTWFCNQNPYVVVLNLASLDFMTEATDLLGVLFGIGDQAINMRTNESSYLFRPFIEKINGEKVSTILFETMEYENISAVMFCDKNILHETKDIEKSMILVHNPFAKNKLDELLFGHIQQWGTTDESIIRIS